MTEPFGTPAPTPSPDPMLEPPKKNNTTLIAGIAAAVIICCCCPLTLYVFYQYLGDPIMQLLGLQ